MSPGLLIPVVKLSSSAAVTRTTFQEETLELGETLGTLGAARHRRQTQGIAASRRSRGEVSPISFAPDGGAILVSERDANDAVALLAVNSDGSGARLLVSGAEQGGWVKLP